MMLAKIFKNSHSLYFSGSYSFTNGVVFLQMVESFLDRADVHTGIRTDRLLQEGWKCCEV
jgi:hypothetical protein